MRDVFESDVQFYATIGVATIAVFVLAVVGITLVAPARVGGRELAGLVAGFALFMGVFFVSYVIRRLEEREDL